VTVSIGVAQLAEQVDEDFTSLLKRADLAMYQAKEQGRNRVKIIAV
jgi:diguanylate cyclase (GGDEF)-like protein